MSRGKETLVDYKLSAHSNSVSGEVICVMGAQKILNVLLTVPGVQAKQQTSTKWIELPVSRRNFMLVEALGIPSLCSNPYLVLRDKYMRVPHELINMWRSNEPMLSDKFVQEVHDVGGMVPTVAQRQFCALAMGVRGMLNASEQGTGKTLMAAMLIKYWNGRTVVMCPNRDLVWQWQAEIYKYLANPPIVIPLLSGTAKGRAEVIRHLDSDEQIVIVTNYHVLTDILPALIVWMPTNVIFDESWMLKNIKAKWTKAAMILADQADHVLCLNGTPFGQDITDLYSQLRLVDAEKGEYFDDKDVWTMKYAKTFDMPIGRHIIKRVCGIKDPVGLVQQIEPVWFRATKASSLDLPEKLKPVKVELLLPPDISKVYQKVEEDGDAVFNPMSLNGDRVATIRKQQVVSGSCPEIHSDIGTCRGGIIPSPKRDWCVDWAKGKLIGDPTYRAIIWCKYTQSILALGEALIDVLGNKKIFIVTAKTKDKELIDAKTSFNTRDPEGVQVFIAQTQKFAYGHNLPGCDWNIIYDHSWSFIERSQLEDRSHRLGRVGPVGYTELICTYTDAKGKIKQTVDKEILEAFESRLDFSAKYGPDTTAPEGD